MTTANKRNNKILFITHSFGMGGAEKLLIDIIKILLKRGFDVDVLTFIRKGALTNEVHKICKVFTLFNSKFHFFLFRRLKSYRQLRVTKFVANGEYNTVVGFMEGHPTALLSDIKIKVHKMAWIHNDFRKLDIGLKNEDLYRMYSAIDKIICVSEDAKKAFFEKLPQLSIDSEVIYNFINESEVLKKAEEIKIINESFTFLNVGMLRPQKKHSRLIRAAAELKNEGYKFQVQIIGDGPLRTDLKNMIFELGVEDCVCLIGLKNNPYPYIKNCDCFVICSEYEGYGIAVKEALLLNKLVLSTKVVGPREILDDGKFGKLVENSFKGLLAGMRFILDKKKFFFPIWPQDNKDIESKLVRLFKNYQ